jgi:hypothetical protein
MHAITQYQFSIMTHARILKVFGALMLMFICVSGHRAMPRDTSRKLLQQGSPLDYFAFIGFVNNDGPDLPINGKCVQTRESCADYCASLIVSLLIPTELHT